MVRSSFIFHQFEELEDTTVRERFKFRVLEKSKFKAKFMANVSLIDAISEVVQWFPRNETYAIPGKLNFK